MPGHYGGFETFAEELGSRLAERGHEVTVYCRTGNSADEPRTYRGMRLVHLPAIRTKYTETLSHAFLSALHAAIRRYDVVYFCNSANAPICFITWLRRQPTVLNVDGLEWRRAKWGRLAKRYYQWAAHLAARMPIELVTDARVIQAYYERRWHRSTRCFVYGTQMVERGHDAARVRALGLEPDRYILYVSRMEPENNALLVVKAYRNVQTDLPLVMVGDAPYANDYNRQVRDAADERVRFLGYRFGDDYHALQANARVYVQATEVGGTHPALVEALGHGNAILAHDVPEHREVLAGAGRFFDYRSADSLAGALAALLADDEAVEGLRRAATTLAAAQYSWDAVAGVYESYFDEIVRGAARGSARDG